MTIIPLKQSFDNNETFYDVFLTLTIML